MCSISHNNFENNCNYKKCSQCNNCFHEEDINKWFNIKDNCPICRCAWGDNNIVYINK